MFCENCGKEIETGAQFCTECGTPIKEEVKPMDNENKLILIVIAIFCGAFGIHNFALGETKKGIVKIVGSLLCGIVGSILAWYDIVKIYKGTYVVDPEAFF